MRILSRLRSWLHPNEAFDRAAKARRKRARALEELHRLGPGKDGLGYEIMLHLSAHPDKVSDVWIDGNHFVRYVPGFNFECWYRDGIAWLRETRPWTHA